MNNVSTKTMRGIKMDVVHRLNAKYQVDIDMFAEVGTNWMAGANNNIFNWFNQDLQQVKRVAACNEYDKAMTSRHQPNSTAIAVRRAMTQYLCKIQVPRHQRTLRCQSIAMAPPCAPRVTSVFQCQCGISKITKHHHTVFFASLPYHCLQGTC